MTISEFVNKIGFKVKNEDVNKVNGAISDIKSTATKLLGAIGIGFSLSSINGLIEEFGAINKSITSSLGELDNVDEAQKKILDGANAVRTSYGDMANTVSNLMKSDESLFPIDDAITFTSNVTKLMKTSGRTESAIQSMMEGFNKSFQKGIVDTETLNKMLEQCPETANLLAEKTGYAKTKLLDMASQGTLKVQDLKDAFISATDEIDKEFAKSGMSISSALQNIRNKWGFWLVQQNKTFGVTNAIGKALVSAFDKGMSVLNKISNGLKAFADKIGGTDNLLKLVAITAAAIFVAFKFDKIVEGIQKIGKAIGGIKAKTAILIAVIILLALIVEDFIAFMNGNDSLFGELLKNAGVDADKFRENIIKIWENIKQILPAIWEGIKNVAIPIFESIWKAIKTVFEGIGKVIDVVAPKFADLLDQIANGNVDTDSWVAFGEAITIIVAAIAGLVAIIKVVTAVKKVWAVVQGIVNAVMYASPITWIIAAIVALIAIIVLLVMNWDKIKEAVQAVWNKIVEVFAGIGEWFKSNVIDPIVNFFSGLWDSIVGIFSGVASWFSGVFSAAWEGIKGIFSAVGGFFQGIWDTIKNIFVSIGHTIADGVSGAFKATVNAVIGFAEKIINGFIGGINSAIGLINKIPGVNIPKISTVNIPKLAEGGYVEANKPQMAVIGDNKHEGEIVSPISKMKEAMYDVMKMFSTAMRPSQSAQMLTKSEKSYVITQNVEFNNEFNGDAAIQRSASSAMDNSARDVTAQLARGLAFAR